MNSGTVQRALWIAMLIAAAVLIYGALFTGQGSYAASDPVDFAEIDRYVQDQMDGSNIPGIVIAIVEGNEIVHARGFGDDGNGKNVTASTLFWIGSNGKSITALAARKLAEAGTLDLNAPVQRYIPTFPVADAEASSRITVRHPKPLPRPSSSA